MSKSKATGLQSKSPAEFFAEHQNIAGFDNAGKSLFTTLREFIENGLDAAETIGTLPKIDVCVEKLTNDEFAALRGITNRKRKDLDLYRTDSAPVKRNKSIELVSTSDSQLGAEAPPESTSSSATTSSSYQGYYRITCRDNGVGMPHDRIPQMLGIVLSSTKYGLRQTRGKFGLGAKMALVWSKKSTGLPIEVRSSQDASSSLMSYCKLDLDIHANAPRVITHSRINKRDETTRFPYNSSTSGYENWCGTEISVVIGGNWPQYQNRVVQYYRQLAVITPYAELSLAYHDHTDAKKNLLLAFHRRSETTPVPPKEVKHHPSSIDNLLMEGLVANTSVFTLKQFLVRELSSITPALADRVIAELGNAYSAGTDVKSLSKAQIHEIVSLLRQMKFPKPDASCLSPLGEYSLRLGVLKEFRPDVVVTSAQAPGVAEGHVFIVECSVAMGGKLPPGISVFRFANRIPLLFEGGNDVASVVAMKKIKWANYKIKQTDKIGVFVSMVSTKIPFKGTSKEYVGDDKGPLHASIASGIRDCCVQLKKRIMVEQLRKGKEEKKKKILKYVGDVSRALAQTVEGFLNQGMVSLAAYDKGDYDARLELKPPLKERAEWRLNGWIPSTSTSASRTRNNAPNPHSSEGLLAQHLRDHVERAAAEEVTTQDQLTLQAQPWKVAVIDEGGEEKAYYHEDCVFTIGF